MRFITFLIISFFGCVHTVHADHASASFETGAAGAIMTTPGGTLPKGKLVVGASVQYLELDDISDSTLEAAGTADEDVHSVDSFLSVSANFAYGLTDDLTIGLSMPYVDRSNIREAHNDMGVGEAELAGDSNGVGDLTLFGQYRFHQSEKQDAAILAGIKTPTGETGVREIEGGLFEAEQQPGSGSWDPFFGLAYNRSWGDIGFSSNLLYTFVTEGTQDTNLGDIFNYNFALSYRTTIPEGDHDHHNHKHQGNIVDYIDMVLELNGDSRQRVDIAGETEKHTGGHTLYISPGLRVGLGHSVSLFTSVGIPIVNDLNGIQSEPDYRVIGGMSVTF
ncbi:MAG: transporter [Gammaproteobacteria bacterium]|nr:MAG: transporter [Gammaproteobacteria bacterium]RKZ71383.1 MAG: transporter [Gammaproteobacteria bacterium]